MALILYADDEERYRQLVTMFLKPVGHQVLAASDGEEVLSLFGQHPDTALVILDVMMPVMDGWETCRILRTRSRVPIIMLTALGDETNEVFGLESGADDYIAKPFRRRSFVARVQAVIKRAQPGLEASVILGPFTINAAAREISLDGLPLSLSPRECSLLLHFAGHPDMVLSREQILDWVWGFDFDGDSRTVDTHVKSLRAKLGPAGSWIRTLRGIGYSFGTPRT